MALPPKWPIYCVGWGVKLYSLTHSLTVNMVYYDRSIKNNWIGRQLPLSASISVILHQHNFWHSLAIIEPCTSNVRHVAQTLHGLCCSVIFDAWLVWAPEATVIRQAAAKDSEERCKTSHSNSACSCTGYGRINAALTRIIIILKHYRAYQVLTKFISKWTAFKAQTSRASQVSMT